MSKFVGAVIAAIAFLSMSVCFSTASAEVFAATKKPPLEDMVYIKDQTPFFIDVFEKGGYDQTNKLDKPDVLKTIQEAESACAKFSKKLPTRAQWLAAASGLGKNKTYTLRGDVIKNAQGELIPHIKKSRGDGSVPINQFEKLGIDISGTVAMTGNRAEWVKDPDGQVYQCGGSFVDPNEADLTLQRICSKKEEKRWYYNGGAATVRCVLSYDEAKNRPLTYSRSVHGELKTYIDTLERPELESSTYEKLMDRCSTKNGVELMPLDGHQRLKDFNLSTLLVPFEANHQTQYFDCRNLGIGPFLNLKPEAVNSKALQKVTINTDVLKSLMPQKAFAEGVFPDRNAVLKFYVDFYAVDAAAMLDAKSQKAFAYYQREKLLQENIWLLEDQGLMITAHNLKKQLYGYMTGPIKKESEVESRGVSDSKKIEVDFGTKGIFKTIKQAEYDARVKREVAAYWMDQILDLRIVPMTVIRKDSRNDLGSYQYWVQNAKVAANVGREPTPTMILLDALLGNGDRHGGNFLFIFDTQYGGIFDGRLSAVDHNRTFLIDNRPAKITEVPSQYAWQKIQELENDGVMHRYFDEYLNQEEMRYLDRGITAVIDHVRNLIRNQGEDKVVFPDKATREPRPDIWELKPQIPPEMPK